MREGKPGFHDCLFLYCFSCTSARMYVRATISRFLSLGTYMWLKLTRIKLGAVGTSSSSLAVCPSSGRPLIHCIFLNIYTRHIPTCRCVRARLLEYARYDIACLFFLALLPAAAAAERKRKRKRVGEKRQRWLHYTTLHYDASTIYLPYTWQQRCWMLRLRELEGTGAS